MKQSSAKKDKSTSTPCENIQQYLQNSSLHGLHYIGTESLSIFERVFFSLAFVTVSILAAYFISNVYQKWKEAPVIIGLDPVSTNIKDIPFPAVTICNMNQVKKSYAKNLTSERDKVILDSICTQGDEIDENSNIEGKWSYVRNFLLNSGQTCEEMITLCKYGMEKLSCNDIFTTVLTDEGVCCTFNSVHASLMFKNFDTGSHVDIDMNHEVKYTTWTPEKGYINMKDQRSPYPRPVPGSGSNMGLTLMLNANVSNYYCSSTSSSGFKILLHSPIETAKVANYGFFIATGYETKVVITPKISNASQLIRKIPKNQRQCMFADEANLSYYKIYSKKNCEMEFSSKKTEAECGCTLYYMPRKSDDSSNICNRKAAHCYETVLFNISRSIDDKYSSNCLPACFEINYGREISSSRMGTGDFLTAEKISTKNFTYIRDNIAIVHIFFNDNSYGGFTKNELIGFTEFLSNTGGLLGLFMGFSVISVIEIFYFLSLRPYCAQKREQATKTRRELISSDAKFLFHQNKTHTNAMRGANNKTTLVGHPYLSEYYKQTETYQNGSCVPMKLMSVLRFIKAGLLKGWKALKALFIEHDDEGQMPYPYYD